MASSTNGNTKWWHPIQLVRKKRGDFEVRIFSYRDRVMEAMQRAGRQPYRTAGLIMPHYSVGSAFSPEGVVTLASWPPKNADAGFHAARVAAFQASKASRWLYRIVKAERRRAGMLKQLRMAEWVATNLCNPPGERRLLHRPFPLSEREVAVLVSIVQALVRPMIQPRRDLTLGGTIRAQFVRDDPLGNTKPRRFIRRRNSRFAARLSRFDWRISSSMTPC